MYFWRPAYLPSRAICHQAKSSGRGRLFRQLSFLGNGTLSWSTPYYRRAGARPDELGCGPRKELTTILRTHGHGDHFFGASTILERFPGARFVARPEVIEIMRQQASPESLATYWNPRFPARFPAGLQSPKS